MADAAAEKQRRSRNQVLREEEQGAHIYRMGPFVLGEATTRDKRGPFSLVPALSYVCFFYFSFKIGFHLLIQLIKL